jgi:hypothetical protein
LKSPAHFAPPKNREKLDLHQSGNLGRSLILAQMKAKFAIKLRSVSQGWRKLLSAVRVKQAAKWKQQ